jgi:hypothetical protein
MKTRVEMGLDKKTDIEKKKDTKAFKEAEKEYDLAKETKAKTSKRNKRTIGGRKSKRGL